MAVRLDAPARASGHLTDWHAVPVFGEPHSRWPTKVRPSAYCITEDAQKRVAIVRTPEGYFLPGGGSDGGESAEQTAIRETEEECSLLVRVGSWRAAAIQHVTSNREGKHFEKRCIFVNAAPIGPGRVAPEPDHELVWATPRQASERLTHAIHRWALEQWLASEDSSLVIARDADQSAIDVAREALDAYGRRDWRKVVSLADLRSLKKWSAWFIDANTRAPMVEDLRKELPNASDERLAKLVTQIGPNVERFVAELPTHLYGVHTLEELHALSAEEVLLRFLMAEDPYLKYDQWQRAAYAAVGRAPPKLPHGPRSELTLLDVEQVSPNKVRVYFVEEPRTPHTPTDTWVLRRDGKGPWGIVVGGSLLRVGGGRSWVIEDPIVVGYLERDKKRETT